MKKAQVLLVVAVLVLCTACAEAVAAPVATPTPAKTPTVVPIPTPAGTPDPLWTSARDELMDNLGACLVDVSHIEARLLTGPVVVAKLIFADEDLNFYVLEVGVEKDEVGYENFVVDAGRDLSDFDRVFIYTAIADRKWEFGFPVEFCQTVAP